MQQSAILLRRCLAKTKAAVCRSLPLTPNCDRNVSRAVPCSSCMLTAMLNLVVDHYCHQRQSATYVYDHPHHRSSQRQSAIYVYYHPHHRRNYEDWVSRQSFSLCCLWAVCHATLKLQIGGGSGLPLANSTKEPVGYHGTATNSDRPVGQLTNTDGSTTMATTMR